MLPLRSYSKAWTVEMRSFFSLLLTFLAVAPVGLLAQEESKPQSEPLKKILIAHRGASAYAPEHTIAAYELALKQGADFVEQDLQITKDGVLVCMHDMNLDRTTNVEEVFPDRSVEVRGKKVWPVAEFTLEEIKKLDAGSWFDPKFKGKRVPTFQEAIDAIRGKAGIYPETKGPESYAERGLSMEAKLVQVLRKNHLDWPGADTTTPVVIQSFSAKSLQTLKNELEIKLPLVLLIGGKESAEKWLSDTGLKEASSFATGIGPAKQLISADKSLVPRAHVAGLTVTPYTFKSSGRDNNMAARDEMKEFLYTFGVEAIFTDNPDLFPREGK
jgi:glycerophosphoryl diester phosphodiesterase